MIRRAKGFELMKIVFVIHFNTFGLKVLLTLKIGFNKSSSYTCDRGHECIIYMI
jgi:hypothetical protein